MGLMDSEESLRKGYKRAGVKALRSALRGMEFSDDDFEIDNLTKDEMIEIIEDYMDFNKGGVVTKKYVNPVTVVNNLKKKKVK